MICEWTVELRNWSQSQVRVTAAEWEDYRRLLQRELSDGNVAGWTTIKSGDEVLVIVTHK